MLSLHPTPLRVLLLTSLLPACDTSIFISTFIALSVKQNIVHSAQIIHLVFDFF